jgi:hypothetical protein
MLGGEADFVVHVLKLLMLLSGVDFGLLLCSQGIHSMWCQVRFASIIFGIQHCLTLFAGSQLVLHLSREELEELSGVLV